MRNALGKANLGTHYFSRTVSTDVISVAGGPPAVYTEGRAFRLNELPGVTDFTNLFDQYCITKIVLKFFPCGTEVSASEITSYTAPRITIAQDFDDITTPLTESELLEMKGHRTYQFTKPITHVIKPAINAEVYRSGITSSYSPKWNQWIDCATVDVPHYGIKTWCQQDSGAATFRYRIFMTFYFKMKGVR